MLSEAASRRPSGEKSRSLTAGGLPSALSRCASPPRTEILSPSGTRLRMTEGPDMPPWARSVPSGEKARERPKTLSVWMVLMRTPSRTREMRMAPASSAAAISLPSGLKAMAET